MIFKKRPEAFNPEIEVVGAYLLHDSKFLTLHRRDDKAEGGKWGLPAGKIDPGEDKHEAMIREIHEETGLQLSPEDISHHHSLDVRNEGYDLIFHIFSTKFTNRPVIKITPEEHQGHQWVTPKASLKLNYVHDLDGCNEIFFGQN